MAYQQTHQPPSRAKATRFVCCECKKLEKVGEEWVKVGPISEEEKIGYRCCPGCDAKTRSAPLRQPRPGTASDKPEASAPEARKTGAQAPAAKKARPGKS